MQPEDQIEISEIVPQEPKAKKLRRFLEWYGLILALLLGAAGVAFGIYNSVVLQNKLDNNFTQLSNQINQLSSSTVPGTSVKGDIQPASDAPMLGSATAAVTVVEYADFQCPFCEKLFQTILPQLKSQYIVTGKIKFYFQDFAFLGPESERAAEAAKCASDQGKFWDYHDKLYGSQAGENKGAFSDSHLKAFASSLGLKAQIFDSCLDTNKYQSAVAKETQSGVGYGVTGTPTIFIDNKPVEGVRDFSVYAAAIDAALKK